MISVNIKTVIFDLDGTLIDSRIDIANAANHALQACGLKTLELEQLVSYVGDGARKLLSRASGFAESGQAMDALYRYFERFYLDHAADNTSMYPGVIEALTSLASSGITLALCTNKPEAITHKVLEALALSAYFKVIVAGDDPVGRKPSAAPILKIAAHLGVEPDSLMMVGDGSQDVHSAQAAGAMAVGVSWGFHGVEAVEAAGAQLLIESLDQLVKALRGHSGKPTAVNEESAKRGL